MQFILQSYIFCIFGLLVIFCSSGFLFTLSLGFGLQEQLIKVEVHKKSIGSYPPGQCPTLCLQGKQVEQTSTMEKTSSSFPSLCTILKSISLRICIWLKACVRGARVRCVWSRYVALGLDVFQVQEGTRAPVI